MIMGSSPTSSIDLVQFAEVVRAFNDPQATLDFVEQRLAAAKALEEADAKHREAVAEHDVRKAEADAALETLQARSTDIQTRENALRSALENFSQQQQSAKTIQEETDRRTRSQLDQIVEREVAHKALVAEHEKSVAAAREDLAAREKALADREEALERAKSSASDREAQASATIAKYEKLISDLKAFVAA